MVRDEPGAGGSSVRRRDVLRTLGAGGVVALAGCDGDAGTPTPEDDTISMLLATAESGEYGSVGLHQRNGFELAIQHLNEGGGLVEAGFSDLSGDGVLGREVDPIIEDTENTAETARSTVDRLLGDGSIGMVTGGVGGDVEYAISEVAADAGVPYMAGTAPVPGLTGERCSQTTFRESAHAQAIVEALAQPLAEEFGQSLTYFQLSSQGVEGQVLGNAFTSHFGQPGTPDWQARGRDDVRPGSTNLDGKLETAAASRPDVVVLNLFGLDAINAVDAANDVLADDVGVVVPVIDDALGIELEAGVSDIVGTIPWDVSVGGDLSTAYEDEYVFNYGPGAGGQAQTGSGTAHVIYTQTLQYAAAAERAGSFDTDAIVAELEGVSYDAGLGEQQLRACDHQSTRPIPVVRGIEHPTADRNRFELVTLATDAVGGCEDAPAADCSL